MKKGLLFKLVLGFWLVSVTPKAFGASDPYGSFVLENGEARVLHNSNLTVVTEKMKPVAVYENDTIQLGEDANGELRGTKNAVIKIGSNAVLKVQSWNTENSQGFLRLIYGKIKATISGLRSNESFNVRTANSIIGVKGTEYAGGVNDSGNSFSWAQKDYVYMTDTQTSRQAIVPQGYYISNFEGEGLQAMVEVDKELGKNMDNLASNQQGTKELQPKGLDVFFVPNAKAGGLGERQQNDFREKVQEVNSAVRSSTGSSQVKTIKVDFLVQ